MEVNNIEADNETSQIFEMHLNIFSDPSESLFYTKKRTIYKEDYLSEKCQEIYDKSFFDILRS